MDKILKKEKHLDKRFKTVSQSERVQFEIQNKFCQIVVGQKQKGEQFSIFTRFWKLYEIIVRHEKSVNNTEINEILNLVVWQEQKSQQISMFTRFLENECSV